MRFPTLLLAVSSISFLTLLPFQAGAKDLVVHAPRIGQTVLVAPDGSILDYVPEAGTVVVRRDRQGRRVLIDHRGNVVATEMRIDRADRRAEFNPDRGWGYGTPDWEPRARGGNRDNWNSDDGYSDNSYGDNSYGDNGYSNDVTGTLPDGRYNRDIPVENQPLPAPENRKARQNDNINNDTASLEPNDGAMTGLPQELESPAPRISMHGKSSAEVASLQVYLDRKGMSPGVIDGKMGSNVEKALHAYEATTGDRLDPKNSEEILQRLSATGGLAFKEYTITASDAAGPYVASIPTDYAKKSEMPSMGYTSTAEMLAERFHMDENYLKSLNPGVDFSIPGTRIKVVDPGKNKTGTVIRIVANKALKEVQAFDAQGNLVAAYPATIGSADTPSPSGTHTVVRIAFNPDYTYNPKINFKQGSNNKVLTIPPGPNGPVGDVWIALSKPTYGIHGTPSPSLIGKTQSHGCVRLTNWDAQELAKMVKPGTIVQFVD